MSEAAFRLLDAFQRDFPLCPRPYAEIGERIGIDEAGVIETLRRLHAEGSVSRIGATIVPGRLGASTLAALAVPAERLESVAALVNGYREVNHNYEREHAFNLWFVVTAPGPQRVQEVVREIECRARCGEALALPMIEAYHLDLGFRLAADHAAAGGAARRAPSFPVVPAPYRPSAAERALLAALQEGLPLTSRPYAGIGARAGMSEEAVLAELERLLREHVLARLGVIVRHREIGYRANAMVVWDVPDGEVRARGAGLAQTDCVTLCYRRPRRLPHWPYNLYCMIHGARRDEAAARIAGLAARCGLEERPGAVLFSRRCFKQRGARYVEEDEHGRDRPPDRQPHAERFSHH